MSNPGVIELISGDMSIGSIRIEDNIGESIHIHIGELRIDMTISELMSLAKEMKKALNAIIDVKGFDSNMFDALFLFQISDFLVDLERVEKKEVQIRELYTGVFKPFGGVEYRKICESRVTKALNGDECEDNKAIQINAIGMTNNDRTKAIYKSVKENGYPYNNKYAVIFGDSQFIRDGQHRLSAVCVINGEDKKVPVLCLHFKNNMHGMSKHPRLDFFFRWDRKKFKKLYCITKNNVKGIIYKVEGKLISFSDLT